MNRFTKRVLILAVFVLCLFGLTILGASAASTDGFADDAAAVAAGKVARVGGTATSNEGATYYDTLNDAILGVSVDKNVVWLVTDWTQTSGAPKGANTPADYVLTSIDPTNITLTINTSWGWDLGGGSTRQFTTQNIHIDVLEGKNLGYFNKVTINLGTGTKITGVGSSDNGIIHTQGGAVVNIDGATFVATGAHPIFDIDAADTLDISNSTFTTNGGVVFGSTGAGYVFLNNVTLPAENVLASGSKITFPKIAAAGTYASDAEAIAAGYFFRLGEVGASAIYADNLVAIYHAIKSVDTYKIYVLADVTCGAANLNMNTAGWDVSLIGVAQAGGVAPKLTLTGSTNLFSVNSSNVSFTIENLELTIAYYLFISDGNNATNANVTIKSGTTIKTAATMSGNRLFYMYDPCNVTIENGAKIDTSATSFSAAFYIFDLGAPWNSTLAVNGELLIGGTGNNNQIRVFNATGGMAGKVVTSDTTMINFCVAGSKLDASGIFIAYGTIEINGGTFKVGSESSAYIILHNNKNGTQAIVKGSTVMIHEGTGMILNRNGGNLGVITVDSTSVQLIAKGSATVFNSPYYIVVKGAYLSCEAASPFAKEAAHVTLLNVKFSSLEMAAKFGTVVAKVGYGTEQITVEGQTVNAVYGCFLTSKYADAPAEAAATAAEAGMTAKMLVGGLPTYVPSLAYAIEHAVANDKIYVGDATDESTATSITYNDVTVTVYSDNALDLYVVGGKLYDSLAAAFEAAANGDTLVNLAGDEATFVLPLNGKIVTFKTTAAPADLVAFYISMGAVARVDDAYFTDLAGAVAAANGKTVALLKDLELTTQLVFDNVSVKITSADAQNPVTLTLSGTTYHFAIKNGGALTLADITVTSNGKVASATGTATLTLDAGATVTGPMTEADTRISVGGSATLNLNINAGALLAVSEGSTKTAHLVYMNTGAKLNYVQSGNVEMDTTGTAKMIADASGLEAGSSTYTVNANARIIVKATGGKVFGTADTVALDYMLLSVSKAVDKGNITLGSHMQVGSDEDIANLGYEVRMGEITEQRFFETLEAALAYAAELDASDVVYLYFTSDYVISEKIVIPAGAKIVLGTGDKGDGTRYTVTTTVDGAAIEVGANANLTLANGNFVATKNLVEVLAGGALTIDQGAVITADGTPVAGDALFTVKGTMNVTGGSITNATNGNTILSIGAVVVTGGTLKHTGTGNIFQAFNGSVEITGSAKLEHAGEGCIIDNTAKNATVSGTDVVLTTGEDAYIFATGEGAVVVGAMLNVAGDAVAKENTEAFQGNGFKAADQAAAMKLGAIAFLNDGYWNQADTVDQMAVAQGYTLRLQIPGQLATFYNDLEVCFNQIAGRTEDGAIAWLIADMGVAKENDVKGRVTLMSTTKPDGSFYTIKVTGGNWCFYNTTGGYFTIRDINFDLTAGNARWVYSDNKSTLNVLDGTYVVANASNSHNFLNNLSTTNLLGGEVVIENIMNNPIRVSTGSAVVTIGGNFKITNNSPANGMVYIPTGKLIIEGGTIIQNANTPMFQYDGSGTVEVRGGYLELNGTHHMIYCTVAGLTATVTGGTIVHNGTGHIYYSTQNNGILNISGGHLIHTGTGHVVNFEKLLDVTITGGTLEHNGSGNVLNYGVAGAEAKIQGGEFRHGGTGYIFGTLSGTNLDITCGHYYTTHKDSTGPFKLHANTVINIYGGYFDGKGVSAVMATNGMTVNIYGGAFNYTAGYGTGSAVATGYGDAAGTVNVYGGAFRSTSTIAPVFAALSTNNNTLNLKTFVATSYANLVTNIASGYSTSEHFDKLLGRSTLNGFNVTTGADPYFINTAGVDEPAVYKLAMRFKASISATAKNQILTIADEGDVTLGMIAISASDYAMGASIYGDNFPIHALLAETGYTEAIDVVATNDDITEEDDGSLTVRLSLTDVEADDTYAVIFYAKYTVNGFDVYNYSDYLASRNARSLAQVARAALNDLSDTQEGDYQHAAGTQYSPYTAEQQAILLEACGGSAALLPLDIYLVAGGNNAAGATEYTAEQAAIMEYGYPNIFSSGFATFEASQSYNGQKFDFSAKKYLPSGSLVNLGQGITAENYGPEIGMANELAKHYGEGKFAAIMKYTTVDLSMADIDAYAELLKAAVAFEVENYRIMGYNANLVGMYWMQGEADYENTAIRDAYADAFEALVSDLRADLADYTSEQNATFPVVVGEIGIPYSKADKSLETAFVAMQATLDEIDGLENIIVSNSSIFVSQNDVFTDMKDVVLNGEFAVATIMTNSVHSAGNVDVTIPQIQNTVELLLPGSDTPIAYRSLVIALYSATAGSTIKLLADIEEFGTMTLENIQNITLDGDGQYGIISSAAGDALVLINSSITLHNFSLQSIATTAIRMKDGSTLNITGTESSIAANGTAVLLEGKNTALNVNGACTIGSASGDAIVATGKNAKVHLNNEEAEIFAPNGTAIVMNAANGALLIDNAAISAKTGIEAVSGNVTVNNAVIYAGTVIEIPYEAAYQLVANFKGGIFNGNFKCQSVYAILVISPDAVVTGTITNVGFGNGNPEYDIFA